jgi:hypothetical protein
MGITLIVLLFLFFSGSVGATAIVAACPLPGVGSGEVVHVTIPLFGASITPERVLQLI